MCVCHTFRGGDEQAQGGEPGPGRGVGTMPGRVLLLLLLHTHTSVGLSRIQHRIIIEILGHSVLLINIFFFWVHFKRQGWGNTNKIGNWSRIQHRIIIEILGHGVLLINSFFSGFISRDRDGGIQIKIKSEIGQKCKNNEIQNENHYCFLHMKN